MQDFIEHVFYYFKLLDSKVSRIVKVDDSFSSLEASSERMRGIAQSHTNEIRPLLVPSVFFTVRLIKENETSTR